MRDLYDIAIVGTGVAGAFAAYKIATEHKNVRMITFDIGRPPLKRRAQMYGWLGSLPTGDGKLYLDNMEDVKPLLSEKRINSSFAFVKNIFLKNAGFDECKNLLPSKQLLNKIDKNNFTFKKHNYIQYNPRNIHNISKFMSDKIMDSGNSFKFDEEIVDINMRDDGTFEICGEEDMFYAKKVILATGRSGWRWNAKLFNKFNLIKENSKAKIGIRIEADEQSLKDLNKCCCTITDPSSNIKMGPFLFGGTVIPEDHCDLAISAFRSNETRWVSEKTSFELIKELDFAGKGYEQTERIAKIIFILSNDRILKERLSTITSGKTRLAIIDEFNLKLNTDKEIVSKGWLIEAVEQVAKIFPDIIESSYFYVPTISTILPKINISSNLETDVKNLYVAGESSGIQGILSAAMMGAAVADFSTK